MQQESISKYEQASQDSNQKYIIVAALSFIVGFGLAWLIVANKNDKQVGIETATGDEQEMEIIDEEMGELIFEGDVIQVSGNFIVPNQPVGVEVVIDNVVLSKPSWVVIHEKDASGQPIRILGAQLFDVGTWSGKVELLRGTSVGIEYIAAIHLDNGDRSFDSKKDLQVKDASGLPTQTVFTAVGGGTGSTE